MKLLSVLTVCAALCVAVTQASPQLQDEETDAASLDQLLEMLAEQVETESVTEDTNEETAVVEEEALSRYFSDLLKKSKANTELEQTRNIDDEVTVLNRGTVAKSKDSELNDNKAADSQFWWASPNRCYCAFRSFCRCRGK